MDKSPDAFRTISEVADDLDLPQHVLRFWETRFSQIKPLKRGGGRRYYRPDDVMLLRGIRHLLYGEGYTIKGVQRILREQGVRHVMALWQDGGVVEEQQAPQAPPPDFYAPRDRGEGARREPVFAGDAEADEEPDDEAEAEDEMSEAALAFAPRRRADAEPAFARDTRDDEPSALPEERRAVPVPAEMPRPPAAAEARETSVVPLRQPPFAPVVEARQPGPARDPVSLPADDIGRLKSLLGELQDCKRMLEGAR